MPVLLSVQKSLWSLWAGSVVFKLQSSLVVRNILCIQMLFPRSFTCICVAPAPLTDARFRPCACSCWAVCAWTSSAAWWLQVPSFVWWITRGSALIVTLCQVPLRVSSALLCYSFCHWFGLHLYFAGFDTLLSHFLAMHVYDFMLQAWSCWRDANAMHDGRQKNAAGLKWWGLILPVVSKCLWHHDRLIF